MTRASSTSASGHDATTRTLGDLLYADEMRTRVSEDEWVGLVRSIAGGDQIALRALWDRAQRIVFTLTVRIINNPQTAEELTLDVFHDIWRRARTYDPGGGTVIGWIMNQARSRAIDRLRFETRQKRVGHDPDVRDGAAPDPQHDFDVREQGRILRDALTALTPHERQAIEIAYFSGFTYAEVAARLQEPLGTVKTRIRSGLEKLRRTLAVPVGER